MVELARAPSRGKPRQSAVCYYFLMEGLILGERKATLKLNYFSPHLSVGGWHMSLLECVTSLCWWAFIWHAAVVHPGRRGCSLSHLVLLQLPIYAAWFFKNTKLREDAFVRNHLLVENFLVCLWLYTDPVWTFRFSLFGCSGYTRRFLH